MSCQRLVHPGFEAHAYKFSFHRGDGFRGQLQIRYGRFKTPFGVARNGGSGRSQVFMLFLLLPGDWPELN